MAKVVAPPFARADIGFSSTESFLSRAIRWFERGKGEEASKRSHVFLFGKPGYLTEARWNGVKRKEYDSWKVGREFEVWRHTGLSGKERLAITRAASVYVGRRYGFLKLGAHMLDGLVHKASGCEVFWFRRACFMDNYPICSWHVAWSWAKGLGMKDFYGVPLYACSPDTMLDRIETLREFEKIYCTLGV